MSVPPRASDRTVMAIAVLASAVSFLDATVVNVALPAIERELGGGLVTQQWMVDAYLLTLGAFILTAGALSDVLGRVVVLRIGLLVFGVASVLVAASPDPVFLIAARALQGVGGALLVPSSLAIITAHFDDDTRGRAIGTWTAFTTAATLVGPVLGGLFVDHLSWRAVFLVNVVPLAAALVLLARGGLVDERRGGRVDVAGAVLCALGLGGVVLAFIEQPRLGWAHPLVAGALTIGVIALAGFFVRERSTPDPLLPLGMFRRRNFWAGNLATLAIYGALSLNGIALGLFLQETGGFSATLAGLATLPATVIMIATSRFAGAAASRFGPRRFMAAGPLVCAAAMILLLTVGTPVDYLTQVLPAVVLFGVGLSLTVAPLTSAVLGAAGADHAGVGSAVNNADARIAGLVTVALLGVVTGGSLDVAGFHATAILAAALFTGGAVVSAIAIRDPQRT
ncbi:MULTISPECIES: MFS transporter [Microbacterium]|uniref:MFS transporter n=1 Tax=Microbacterium TaxID=33882 RepID=UPI001F2536A7|nr:MULTISPECIES: MFS transporter [unclassified Microbacterium]